MSTLKLSVELEPPNADLLLYSTNKPSLATELDGYRDLVSMISITNRPVFGLSPVTMAKRVKDVVTNGHSKPSRICVHLTTRLSHFDFYKTILDAHRMKLHDILPILGDPRGPKDDNYFSNGYEILGFTSYLKSGNTEVLSTKYQKMLKENRLVNAIPDAKYKVGSVIDLNPYKISTNGAKIKIGLKQIASAQLKENLGAEYLISQGIYDAKYYFDFIENADLQIPIIPGVMPARLRLIEKFGIPIAPLKKQMLRAALTTKDEKIEGNRIAKEVLMDLQDGGAQYAHIYSLGRVDNFYEITGLSRVQDQSYFEENKNSKSSFTKQSETSAQFTQKEKS
ncbi:MAG: methylenetetrahydrofolate reductase [Candidatus Heimdallarchaeota archaeon]|nr:methylenetetrahydrofolate reductase [Candidatus Heimdallarchaeota archaeon]